MKFNHKTATCLILVILAAVTLTSCKPKSYGDFKVVQSKSVTGDYIILPALTIDEDAIAITANPDKTYHVPLLYYKAVEKKLADLAVKFNDFSTGITSAECDAQWDLFYDDYGSGLFTDEKAKSSYYAIITDLLTKQEAHNAEASAFYNEFEGFQDILTDIVWDFLESLTDVYDYANKKDSWTESHEELFTEGLAAEAQGMKIWFPSVSFISSFEEKTGPYIENPWIPDWEDLISLMTDLNNNYANDLITVDSSDPDEIEEMSDYYYDLYSELEDIWYELPSIEKYEEQYDALTDKFFVIDDKADDMWDKAYDAYWDSYWDYYWY